MTEENDNFESYIRKAEERLQAAELLFEKGYYDDSVSRAYYCIYNSAKAALSTKDKDATTHKGLITLFGQEFVKKGVIGREIGTAFSYVEEEREEADYDPLIDTSKEEAARVLEKAKSFLSAVRPLR